ASQEAAMRAIIGRLTYANVMSTVAVALLLGGGTAYAVTTVNGANIQDHTIAGEKLINDTLTGTQVKESTLAAGPNASKPGGLPPSAYVKGANIGLARASKSISSGTQGTFTTLFTIPGLGTLSAECYNTGDSFGEKFTDAAGTTEYVAVLLSNEDDSSHAAL